MADRVRPQPYRLDPPADLEKDLPAVITNADEMFQTLFEDLKAVNDAVESVSSDVEDVAATAAAATSAQGVPGREGDEGPESAWPLPGPQGRTGPTGATGAPGPDGAEGEDGATWPAGRTTPTFTGTGAEVRADSPTLTSPIFATIAPAADFSLTQNATTPFRSVASGALVDTLLLSSGRVTIGSTGAPGSVLLVKSAVGSGDVQMEMRDTSGTQSSIFFGGKWVTGNPGFGTNTTHALSLITNNLERLKIGTAGDIDIKKGVTPDGGGVKHTRVTTGSIAFGASALITITWATAFADANYTVVASVLDATTSPNALRVVHVESISSTVVTVRVENAAAGGAAITGTLHVLAIHD